jgi:hypothetical protein
MITRFTFAATLAALMLSMNVAARAAGGQRGALSGVVVDSSGQPVADATVTLTAPTGRYRTKSDNRGRWFIVGVDVDTYSVRITKAGYADAVMPSVDALGDQTQDLGEITLKAA